MDHQQLVLIVIAFLYIAVLIVIVFLYTAVSVFYL